MRFTTRKLAVGAVAVALAGGGVTWAGAATGDETPSGQPIGWGMMRQAAGPADGEARAEAAAELQAEAAAEAQGPAARTVVVVGRPTDREKFVDEDPEDRENPGDAFLFSEDLLQDGQVVGYDNVKFTLAFRGGALVEASFVLRGRGKLEVSGFVSFFADTFFLPVTGGTGEFRGAKGVLVVDEATDPDPDARFTFRLL